MTHTIAENIVCADCRGPLDEPSRHNRFAPPGRVMLVLHSGSNKPCGCCVHEECIENIRNYGAYAESCPCGAGPIVDGVLPEEVATETDEQPEESEEEDDDESDDSDDSDDNEESDEDDDGQRVNAHADDGPESDEVEVGNG